MFSGRQLNEQLNYDILRLQQTPQQLHQHHTQQRQQQLLLLHQQRLLQQQLQQQRRISGSSRCCPSVVHFSQTNGLTAPPSLAPSRSVYQVSSLGPRPDVASRPPGSSRGDGRTLSEASKRRVSCRLSPFARVFLLYVIAGLSLIVLATGAVIIAVGTTTYCT